VGTRKRGNEGEYGGCILSIHENRKMKPVEIVLRSVEEGKREQWRG
jgi:hypothetical protein